MFALGDPEGPAGKVWAEVPSPPAKGRVARSLSQQLGAVPGEEQHGITAFLASRESRFMQPLCCSWPEIDLQPLEVPLMQLTPPPCQFAKPQRAASGISGSGSSSSQLKGVAVMTATTPRPYLPSLPSPHTYPHP